MNPMHSFIKGKNLPPGWRRTRAGALGQISSGSTPSRSSQGHFHNGSIPWVKTGDLTNWKVIKTEEHLTTEGLNSCSCRVLPSQQTVLIAMYGGFKQIGRTGLLTISAATNQAISAIVCDATQTHAPYLLYWFNGYRFLWVDFAGSSRKDPNITKRDIESFPVVIPPVGEQKRIADILTTWDEALEKLDALIAAKARRKQALMQQLLTGRKRVKGATGKWKKMQLGELAENRSDQNKGKLGTELLYGVTKADGVVPMRDHVKGESFHHCKLLDHDWFAYNPMRINIGSIARWQGNKTVMVSGDYVVFRCFEERLSPAYLDHLRQSWMWHSFVTKGGNGSVRIRIYFSDLAEFTFPCPPIEEQHQIATILDTADQELTLLRRQREALDQQKRGLMQRLLTGTLRVTTDLS